jgi:AraC family transcriptional regulator
MPAQLESGQFYGRTLKRRLVAGLTLADVVYPTGVRLPRHAHERAYFCLIRQGAYTEQYGRRTRVCGPMTLAFHPAGEAHSQALGRTVASFNVEVGSEWMERVREVAGPLDQPIEFHGGYVAELGSGLFNEFSREDSDAALAIESLAAEILGAIARSGVSSAAGRPPRWLIEARDMLDARFPESPTLRGIAREAGVHPVYFASLFRRFHGCSAGEYVRRRRIEYVRNQLASSDLPLAAIALDAGFADQSHFTRTFKRFTGMTPAQYRTFLPFKTN